MHATLRTFCWLVALPMLCHAGVSPRNASRCVAPHIDASLDTIFIPGGTLTGAENAGSLETTINGDTAPDGSRLNRNRVYALYQGQVYFQQAPIIFREPRGRLTICGVPSDSGTTKPIILIAPAPPATTVSANGGTTVNVVYGSIKCDGIHYQAMQLTGSISSDLFLCGTSGTLAQSLDINNSLFEFCNVDLFNCSNEPGAIGGWPYGAKFRLTNSYFRNLFHPSQWWGSRIFQCKHPIDTLWVENCTVTTAGVTFLQTRQLTDFTYINHNTFVNTMKSLLFSPYHRMLFITQNIFINQNWVGEDRVVLGSGQDPDRLFMSTINLDTNNTTNGLVAQGKYYSGDSMHFTAALDLNKLRVFVSDNIDYYDPLLVNGYYNSGKYRDPRLDALPAFTDWGNGPYPIGNVPGLWMNSRTLKFFIVFGPGVGGFVEARTSIMDPGTATPGIADASIVDSMAAWNQHQWGDPRFPAAPALEHTRYILGDYSPRTLPGIVRGVKTDQDTLDGAGITRFTDLTENFSQNVQISAIDGLPIGALIWDDAKLAAYNSAADFQAVYTKYITYGYLFGSAADQPVASTFALLQNSPNPFNPRTAISYQLPAVGRIRLTIYDLLGREVKTLVDGTVNAGLHTVTFDAGGLASGVYFCRLCSASGFVATRRMMLLR